MSPPITKLMAEFEQLEKFNTDALVSRQADKFIIPPQMRAFLRVIAAHFDGNLKPTTHQQLQNNQQPAATPSHKGRYRLAI